MKNMSKSWNAEKPKSPKEKLLSTLEGYGYHRRTSLILANKIMSNLDNYASQIARKRSLPR